MNIEEERRKLLDELTQKQGNDYIANVVLDEIIKLRMVCAEAYQVAGCLDAPEEILDYLLAAAQGDPLPFESMLPFTPN